MSPPNPILSLIDLDVKPIDRLPGWARLDRELVESYVDIDGRLCIDAFRRNQGQ
ncbi:hypothetical protein SISNIDRAFT_458335 [Sistotremastrum niveocremeum HHB9708]|uniref:Uncharacterized protein n=1 Tax=Sistotremastrum niveocremeum HHB9708 TaxID=1314777 RepID=A0A164QVD4_9AGAM|nr:hypothetical protein SISNIDRAFT_458335 [Sistotremastrum niveocremeum HHB9708]